MTATVSGVLLHWCMLVVESFRLIVRGKYRYVFFFQAEDGMRDLTVTGVQTCALPISRLRRPHRTRRRRRAGFRRRDGLGRRRRDLLLDLSGPGHGDDPDGADANPARPYPAEIGRASCRERV